MTDTIVVTEQIPGPDGPSVSSYNASGSVPKGYAFVMVGGYALVANTANLTQTPIPSGVATTASSSGQIYGQTSGVVLASITGLGVGVASAVGVDSSGKLVRSTSALCVSGFYVGDCNAVGDLTINVRQVTTLDGCVILEQFGAKGGDNATDAAAMTMALAAAKPILLQAKTYIIDGYTGLLAAGCAIIGVGQKSALQCTSNQSIAPPFGGPGCGIYQCKLIGTFGAGANNHGVNAGGHSDGVVSDVDIVTPGGDGIRVSTGEEAQSGVQISRVRVYVPVNGAAIRTEGMDYVVATNVKGYGGTYGLRINAGNFNGTGCSFELNSYGCYIDNANWNDGHPKITGCSFNHSTVEAVHIEPLVNGANFVGCHFYYGAGTIKGTVTPDNRGVVRFYACNIDLTSVTSDGARVRFDACTWPLANANTMTLANGGTISFDAGNVKLDGNAFAGGDAQLDFDATKSLLLKASGVTRAKVAGAHGVGSFGNGGSDAFAALGPLVGSETGYGALWLLANGATPTGTNPSAYSDGSDLVLSAAHPLAFGKVRIYAASAIEMATFDSLAGRTTLTQAELNLASLATTATAPGAGGAGALPATPAGYVTIHIGGTARKVPYY